MCSNINQSKIRKCVQILTKPQTQILTQSEFVNMSQILTQSEFVNMSQILTQSELVNMSQILTKP